MTTARAARPVVVGVDGSSAALDALDWAAAEAASRQSPMRVVHIFTPSVVEAVDPLGLAAAARYQAGQTTAEDVLDEAVSRARTIAPEIRVMPRLVTGPAGPALLEQSRDAGLLVLGHRSGRPRRPFSWSLDAKVVAHARCPVAVVTPFRVVPHGRSAARVVVGVDSSTQSSAALGYAYRAAAQRGIGLTAVHAWTPRGTADFEGVADDVEATERNEQRILDQALDGWATRFPGVSVHTRLVQGCAAAALITESAGAALTVVGSRSRKGIYGLKAGRLSQLLIRYACCPVAVLRSPL